MEGFDQGVALESPASTDPSVVADPSSAGTQNTEQPGQPIPGRENWMPQARAEEMAQRRVERAIAQARQEMAQEFATERQQMQQYFAQQSQAERQALLQGLQQRVNQPSRSPEEEAHRRQAQELLHDLAPGLKAMPALAQSHMDLRAQVEQLAPMVTQLREAQTRTFLQSEENRLYQLASAAGMKFASPQEVAELNDDVANIIARSPQALQAVLNHDQRVLPLAFQAYQKQNAAREQRARASVAQTKSRMPPPRIGGSAPGSTPIPKYDPKDHRGSMAKIHAGAAAAWEQMTG